MKKYVGLTIGPIIETMSYTSTPAGLWAASYFFSSITKNFFEEFKKKDYQVLTVPENVCTNIKGIGQYHDRIYAGIPSQKSDMDVNNEVREVIDCVIENRAKELQTALADENPKLEEIKECLKDYLQIHYIIMQVEDTQVLAKTLAGALDALENCQSTAGNLSKNYLIQMLNGKRENSNTFLKNYPPFQDAQLTLPNGNIRDLHSIARNAGGTLAKTSDYFAIIQADGDGMGKIVNADLKGRDEISLADQENRIQIFSELCMEYTSAASNIIRDYKGVVLYAGGDDLLFLAPIVKNEDENIWTLCSNIGERFNSIFNPEKNKNAGEIVKAENVPSISFGVSVNYYKFPLYEAFADARNMLFDQAKKFGAKNNFAISVHKASGQTSGYVCRMKSGMFEEIIQYTNMLCGGKMNPTDNNQMLHSLLYHMENSRELLKIAISEDGKCEKYFSNVFDNSGQKAYREYIDSIQNITKKIWEAEDGIITGLPNEDSKKKEERAVDALINILRTAKLLVEER